MKIAKLMLLPILVFGLAATSCRRQEDNVLTLWTMFTGADGTTFTQMVEAFNATNPTFRVEHIPITAEDLYLRLQLSVSSGVGVPDIAVNHIERIALFQDFGNVTNLAPFLAQSPIRRENYLAGAWDAASIAGGQYGIPLDIHSYILYVNWDLYTQLGLNVLDDGILTWDEILQVAPIALEHGIVPIGLGWIRVIFLASYAQMGGTLSANGIDPSFDNEIARQVLRHYRSLVESGLTQMPGEDSWMMFLGGNILFMPEGIWMYNHVRETGLNTRSFDFPVFSADRIVNWTSSHQFTIPTQRNPNPERIAASLEFIDWIGRNSEMWAEAGQVPAHVGGQTARFGTFHQAFLADRTSDQLDISDYRYFGYAVEALDTVLADIIFGNIDLYVGLRQAEQEVRDRIAFGR